MLIKKLSVAFLLIIAITHCSTETEQKSSSNPVTPITQGTIKGTVYDADTSIPLSYSIVTTLPGTEKVYTNLNGEFIIENVEEGSYTVYAFKEGYDNDSVKVVVKPEETTTADIYLLSFSNYLDYYPLDIGDYWEYQNPEGGGKSIEVVSDTLIYNKLYKVIIEKDLTTRNILGFRYERVDTFYALVYRYYPEEQFELVIDSMAAKEGQMFSSNMFVQPYVVCTSLCLSIEERNIFGTVRKVRTL